jgi:Skp family chaperone for outer membrane proteins
MKFKFATAAAAILAVCLFATYANAGQETPVVKKHTATAKEKKPKPPTVEEQIQEMRQDLQNQINGLKTDLANKDSELRQAKEAAAEAQAAADRANAAASSSSQAVSDNTAAVSTLQSTVTDLKGNQASLAATVSDETAKIKKEINSPNVLHYKGVSITPGGFIAGETVWRSKATGGDIPTAFSSIPYESADAYSLSEFFGDARQSRVSMMVQGKPSWGAVRGYYEADWLGTGITSNNNQSNSYVLRQRVLWAQAETNTGWAFTAGQLWSLATEDKKGISNLSGDILTPLTIDPNYNTGFVWTRQYGFRVTKTFKHAAFGIAAENPQLLYTASIAGNTPYAVLGSAGQNGGNFNAAISASSTTTYVQNYTNGCVEWSSSTTCLAGEPSVALPAYATIVANTNIANISFNQAPDMIFKAAFDPGWGHYEVFGIAGFAHETVYPGTTTNSVKYGGQKDIATGANVWASSTSAGSHPDSIILGGVGGSLRVPVIKNKLDFGVKGLYGPGMGRYGDTTLADVTADANGNLAPIHNASGLFTLEATPTPRLTIYLNYGGDYAGRTDFSQEPVASNGGLLPSSLGSPAAEYCPTTSGAFTCTKTPTAADIALGGSWGGHWSTPTAGTTAVGYGSRYLSNSACPVIAAPGYNSGSSTGYLPGGSCGAQTRDVQEATAGWWYDIYKGDHGRFRQGFQYSYAVREGWSGASGIGAKGIDNMFWTSIRYYLP